MKSEEIRYIESDVKYVLMRPSMYVGSTQSNQATVYLLENNQFVKKQIEYIPAFIKLVDEVLSNSVDEFIKTKGKFGNKIEVSTDVHGRIFISDNGRGISSEIEPNTKLPQAVVALTKLRSGSNFEKEQISIGQNGVGAALVNIFSKEFIVETSDGNKRTNILCRDNLNHVEHSQKKCNKQYTKITFEPDYQRLNMVGLDSVHLSLIEKRLININLCYPDITITFNGKKLPNITLKNYIKLFGECETIFTDTGEFIDIAIVPFQPEYDLITFVNGIDTTKHGQHSTVFSRMFEKALKEYKKTANIRLENFLTNCKVFIIVKNFKNPEFSSQTKEELTNSYSEVKEYFNDISFDKLLQSMLRNKEFATLMKDYTDAINRLNERKALSKEEKALKKHRVSKFIAPISNKKEFCNFYICEGDSAISQLINVRNNFVAGYPLRGKVINPRTAPVKKLLDNENLRDLIALLGLKISDPDISGFKYRAIYFLCDQDCDGNGITGQLLNIFFTFWPDLFHKGKVFKVMSPLIIAMNKKTKEKEVFYSLSDYYKKQDYCSIIEYNKGLGSLDKEEYRKLVNNPVLIQFSASDFTEKKLDLVFGKSNADDRKEWLIENEED